MPRRDPWNRTRFWKPRELIGLSLMDADFKRHDYAPHWHEALVVGVTEEGGSEIKSRGQVEQADPAALFVFNPSEPHCGWMGASRHWHYRSMYLTRPGIDALLEALGLQELPGFTENKIADPQLARSFLHLHKSLGGQIDADLANELLLQSFERLFRHYGHRSAAPVASGRSDGVARSAMAWMRERFQEHIPLREISCRFDVSQYQLISIFKRAYGMTPHACLTQIRLNEACRLLRLGWPPAQAASEVGFYDQSALGKHFKRCYGITPLQYAKAVQH